jgi:ribosomal protein S18 acetylase RimI-like enzyme
MTGKSLARDILAPDASEYGLFDADQIVAFGQLIDRTAGRTHLARLIVHPRRRGEGLGALLLDRLIAEARSRGVSTVSLNVDPANLPAVSIYARAGFTEGRSPPREDGITALELALRG